MRTQRSRRVHYDSLAVADDDEDDEFEDYAQSTSADQESEEEEDATRSQAKEYGARKESTTTKTGLYNEQSDEESSPNSSSQEEDTEYQVQDNNDEFCSSCRSKKDSDKLLCCELCPRVYHLYCLKPPLKAIPTGDWFCTHCQKILVLEHVEKFLAARTRMVDLEAEKAAEEAAAQAAQQEAANKAAQAKKRKAVSTKMPMASKKPKMASVQQLHTADSAGAAQSRSATQSQSAGSDKQKRASSSSLEAESPPKGKQAFDQSEAQPASGQSQQAATRSSSGHTQDVHMSVQPKDDSQAQQQQQRPAAAASDQPSSLDATKAKQAGGMGASKGGLTSVKEYYVKWKGKSFIHCSWVKHDDVVKVAKTSSGLNMRFRHYQRSVYGMPQIASSAKLEDQEVGDLVNGVDPLWVLVDRVVAQQDKKGLGVQYLVKWKGLGYDECTWESPADLLPKFEAELARFHELHPIANELAQRKKSHPQASTSQADTTRSAAGRKIGTRKFAESPGFLAGGGSLHPYQLEGLNWLYFAWEQRKHVILADEMGLGKTIQSIAFLAALKQEEQVQKPHLVVVPLSTFPNWEREFALWAPQLNVVPFIGNQAGRNVVKQHELYADPSHVKRKSKTNSRHAELQARVKFHVLLTTYEMVGFEASTLRSLEYETLIVDEGHRLKNQQSKLFQQLHNFKTRQRTLLTGTPLQNNLAELWMLLHFLDAGKFQSLQDFEADFSDVSHGDQIAKLHELLSPHLLRRLKKDVLKQLPPKKEQIVRVELSPLQKDWYRGILTKNFPNLTNGKQTGRLKSVMMELRKCCNHPFLIDEQEWPVTRDPEQLLQQLVQASGKLALVDSMLARMKGRGHRVLIYSQFTTLLDLLEEWLTARQWGYQRIDGSVGGAERQSRIDQFNRRPADNFVFLLSTKAGGLGINLASADTVIIYDSDWNPHNDLQAQARAHRLGQLKPVMIYRLVTRLTIEERMMQQTKKKMMLEHLVVHKMNTAADLKQDELDDILRYGAAELFADAVAASQKAQQAAATDAKEGGGSDAGNAAGLASKTTADKADKLIRLSEREQAEGRTGGQAGQRIVYDDAAIERLLDRSDLASADDDKTDEKEDDFVKGFKVANFEIIDSPDKGGKVVDEEVAALEAQPSGVQQPAAAFWDELLKSGYQDLQQTEMAALGKGKRERRKVNYDEKNAKGREDVSDYSAQSEESGDESCGEEADLDKPALKKRKSDAFTLSEAESKAVQPAVQQRQASLAGGAPLTSGVSFNYRVLGFSNTQRALFMKVLMQFGLGQQLQGGKFDWSHIHRHMTGRWPPLSLGQTCRYAELVMAQLSEPANDKPYFADGIAKKEILQAYELNKVLDRLGTLHLVRHTLLRQMPEPDSTFSLGPAHAPTLRPYKFWQAQHDKKLLYGVLKHGWAQWQVILKDKLLEIEPVLRQELCMPPMPPPQPAVGSDQVLVSVPAQELTAATTSTAGGGKGIEVLTIGGQGNAAAPSNAVSTALGAGQGTPAAASQDSAVKAVQAPNSASSASPADPVKMESEVDAEGQEHAVDSSPSAVSGANEDTAAGEQQPASAVGLEPEAAETMPKPEVNPQLAVTDKQRQNSLPADVRDVKPKAALQSGIDSKPDMVDLSSVDEETPKQEPGTSEAESAAKLDEAMPQASQAAVAEQPGGASSTTPSQQQSTPAPLAAAAIAEDLGIDKDNSAAAAQATAKASAPGTAPDAEEGTAGDAKPQVVLGCPKCRWAPKGCASCRARPRSLAAVGAAPAAHGQAGITSSAAVAAANAGRATRSDRAASAAITKMSNWLMNRTSTLCTALKQTHQTAPAQAQPQTRVTLSAPSAKLMSIASGPVITTHQTVVSRPSGGAMVTSAPGLTSAVQTGASASGSGVSQWQQQAVQMSQFRQQQRMIQQQQLAEAQRQQQQTLLVQQQQRQHHTSLLRQQHQTAQLQQQQQQAARTQAAAASALQQQQHRMRQQQQQQGLRQQQLQQQQQQHMQQQLLQQQQQQRQLTAQQQVQYALSQQRSQQAANVQPRLAAVFTSAAQHAQYQQQQRQQPGLQGISHPLSQPDKAGTPLLMAMHQQQANLRAASLPRSPSLSRSPSLPHHQPAQLSSQPSSQLPSQPSSQPSSQSLQQAAPKSSQPQQQGQAMSRLGQASASSPLNPAFRLLPDAEKNKGLREFLLGVKPNLQPMDLNQVLQRAGHGEMSAQSVQHRQQVVGNYSWLCSKLIDVQVTLAQNKPHSMTDHDRNAAAANFQNSMQEMDSHCAKMVDLLSTQAGSSPPPAAQSNPVVHGQGQAGHGHPPIPQPQASLPAVPALVKGPSGEVKGSLERVMVVEPSAAAAAKGLSTEAKGSTARLPSTEHPVRRDGLASLVAPALETSSPTRKVAKAHLSSPFAPAQNTVQSVPLSRPPVGSASVRSNGKAVPAASAAPDKQQGDATGIPPESLESIDLTAGSDEDAT